MTTSTTPTVTIVALTIDRTTLLVQGSAPEPYRVTLGQGWGACSCDDALHRARECKHVHPAREALLEAQSAYTVNGPGDSAAVIRTSPAEGWTCMAEYEGPDAWRLAAAMADKLNAARPKLPQAKKASKAA